MASVEGIEVNAVSEETLSDVHVAIIPADGVGTAKSVTTDSAGKFSVNDLRPGPYTLMTTRTLFFRPRRDSGPVSLTLAPDQHLRDIRIRLAPTAVVSGRVTDENRSPRGSVRVEAVRYEYRDGVRELKTGGQAQTDDRGEYRIFDLPAGSYYLRAEQLQSGAGRPSVPTYFPGASQLQSAVPITLAAGTVQDAVDFSLL